MTNVPDIMDELQFFPLVLTSIYAVLRYAVLSLHELTAYIEVYLCY
jgi:hypothetical protein